MKLKSMMVVIFLSVLVMAMVPPSADAFVPSSALSTRVTIPSVDAYCYTIHTNNQGKCSDSFSVSSTPLFGSPSSVQEPKPHPSGVNLRLIGQSAISQILLGITIWTGGPQYQTLIQHYHVSGLAVLGGLVGTIPLIALSRQVEQSESYLVSGLNLSTNMAVLRFFGSTRQPIVALLLSLALSSLTGLVEETTFRGQILPALTNSESFGNGNLVVGAALSTFVFAILHTNPAAFFPTNNNTESVIDNLVLLIFQLINGAWFTVLYVASGTNLVVPIVAHTLYDTYTFYKTHMVDVAGQMDYAQQQVRKSSMAGSSRTNSPIQQKWIQSKGADFVSQAKEAFYLMDTNRDGVLSVKELKIALYSYGIRLSPAQWNQVKGSADLDGSGDIDGDEFLEFMGPAGSTTQAVRYTFFGPI